MNILQKFASNKNQTILIILLLIVLFSLPFLWSRYGVFNIGGDDSRLYLYSPSNWLHNVAMWSWFSISGLSSFNPQIPSIPFSFLAIIIKNVFFFLTLQKAIYGLVLSVGFLSVYLLLGELIHDKKGKYSFIASIIGGLSYVFSPILFYIEWPQPLHSLYGIFTFPLLLLFFIKAINQKKISYLIFGSVVGSIFSLAIFSLPWSLAFLLGSSIFLFFHFFLIEKHKTNFVKYSAIYLCIFVLMGSFWILPFLHSAIFGGFANQVIAQGSKEVAVTIVNAVAPSMNILDTLSGLLSRGLIFGWSWPQSEVAEYTFDLTFLSILMSAIMFSGLLIKDKKFLREKKTLIALVITTLILAYFQTVNIGNWGIGLFNWLTENVPGWSIFRNFYGKFPIAYSSFYSITLGVSVYLILQNISKERIKKIIVITLLLIILLQSVPFTSGGINNLPVYLGTELNRNVEFPQYYVDSIKYVESLNDGKVLTLPLTFASWSIFKSQDTEGVYIGGSPIKIFTGRDDFNGKMSFESIPGLLEIISNALQNDDHLLLRNLFVLLNIKYIFYNSNIYNFEEDTRRRFLWKYDVFSNKANTEHLISNITDQEIASFGPISIYELSNKDFLPHIYPSTNPILINGGVDEMFQLVTSDDSTVGNSALFCTGIHKGD